MVEFKASKGTALGTALSTAALLDGARQGKLLGTSSLLKIVVGALDAQALDGV